MTEDIIKAPNNKHIIFKNINVQFSLIIKLEIKSRFTGFIGFDNYERAFNLCQDDIDFLKIIANIILILIEKKLNLQKIIEHDTCLRDLQQIVHIGSWKWDIEHNSFTTSEEFNKILEIEEVKNPKAFLGRMFERIHQEDR